MKIFSKDQIIEADRFTIENDPIASIDLMERAAKNCFEWINENIINNNSKLKFKIFCGTGNNGGDGLAIARLLTANNQKCDVYIVKYSDKYSPDFLINRKKLESIDVPVIEIDSENFPEIQPSEIVVDAIFGTGLSKPVTGFTARLIQHINKSGAKTISIDIPSGLFADSNEDNIKENIIAAHTTLSLEFPKLSFMLPEYGNYAGNIEIISIGISKSYIESTSTPYHYIDKKFACQILKKRKKFSEKKDYGHALIIAGSYGKMGAAILASKSCIRSGAGLVTAHIPQCGYEILQNSVPEAMISIDDEVANISTLPKLEKYNAIGVGPGVGTEKSTENIIKLLIQNSTVPLVFDADAINILAENKTWLSFIKPGSIFTPHIREFTRITEKPSNDFDVIRIAAEFTKKYQSYIILKGAHTTIFSPTGNIYFNSTGNPGMATAGSGDVLTGIITGLLTQNYNPADACILGVYLHGLSADIALQTESMESLIAGDIIQNIGNAFLSLIK
jgi:ADP-dependent NAD(P)H-hydrate dehydratase / NAD(P)H-hydrate epimerase